MDILFTEPNKFIFSSNYNCIGSYRLVIKLANINGLVILDQIIDFDDTMENYWVCPAGKFFSTDHSFLVEVYQASNLINSKYIEQTSTSNNISNTIRVNGNDYNIFNLSHEDELNFVSDDSICFLEFMQYYAYKEIFIWNNYWKESYSELFKDSTILDIGSNVGMFSLFSVNKGASKVYSFEPIRNLFSLLSHNTKDYRDIILPINAGVSDKDEWKSICVDWSGMGYCGERVGGVNGTHATSDQNKSDRYRTEFWKADSIFNRLNLSSVDIIKLDCEGGEFHFLKHISDENLNKIKLIICEWHVSDDKRQEYEEIQNRVLESGFSLSYSHASENNHKEIFTLFYENNNLSDINNTIIEYTEDDYEILTSFGQRL